MKKTTDKSSGAVELRMQAEAQLSKNRQGKPSAPLTDVDTQRLLHELEVHQIELEMQNEELRRTQAELEASQARYFDLFDLAPVSYILLNEKGLILEANLTAATQLGVARSALVKQPLTHFILPADQDIYYFHRKQLFETGAPQVCELQMQRADSEIFWARIDAVVVQDADRAPVCRFVLTDITADKLAEEEIRKLSRAVEQSPNIVIISDVTGKIVYVNPKFVQITGFSPEDVIGKTTSLLRSEKTPPEVFANIIEIIASDQEWHGEIMNRTKNGADYWVQAAISPIKSSDLAITHFVEIEEDISRRKQVEDENGLTASLISLVNSKSDFREIIASITAILQAKYGYEAVGIRLRDGEDYPYYETVGFPPAHIQAENRLCVYGPDGKIMRNGSGNPMYECMCGNILCGRFDPTKPFFTAHGSFWTNSTTALLASTTEADRQARTRNRCNGEGYESVALIPLRAGNQVFGLLQFNDTRQDRFTPDLIAHFERLTDNLANSLTRRQAEDALRESEARFHALFEQAAVGVGLVDMMTGRFMDINQYYCDFLGYSKEEMLKANYQTFTHPDDVQENIRQNAMLMAGENREFSIEKRYIRKDGSIVWGFLTASPLWAPCEKPSNYVHISVVQDITERKLAEEALRESQERFKAIALNTPDHIVMQDRQLRYRLVVNPQLGLTEQEMIGKTDYDFLSKEEAEQLTGVKTRVLQTGKPIHFETSLTSKTGDKQYFDGSFFPKFNAQGQVDGLIGYFMNVTERKQITNALRESEGRYQALFENVGDGVSLVDPDERFILANPAAENIFGVPPGDLAGRNLRQFMTPEEMLVIHEQTRLRQAGKKSKYETEINRPDGEKRRLLVTAAPFMDNQGQFLGTLSLFLDITERKLAEKLQNTIYRIAQAADQAESLDSLYPTIHTIIQEVMVAKNFYIALYDDKNGLLSFPYSVDEDDYPTAPRKPKKGLTEYVLRTGKSLLCDEAMFEKLTQSGEMELIGIQSPIWLGVPLIVAGKAIGAMVVQDYKNAAAYGEREQRILEFVSSQTAMAIRRKQAEETLRLSERRFREILENVELIAVTLDTEGRITFCNDYLLRLTSRSRADVLGQSWFAIFVPPDQHVEEAFRASLSHGAIFPHFENDILTASGERRLVSWNNIILQDAEGHILGTTSIGEDITERKRAEDALLQSEAALKQAQQVAQVGSWIWHVQSNQLEWSDEMYHIFGIEKENFSGDLSEVINRAIHPEDRAIVERSNLSVINDKKPIPVEYRVILPDGTVRVVWAEAGKLNLDDAGNSVTLTGIVQDITERKRAEEALARSNDQLRALTAYWQSAIEAERANISREIHDEFGQSMTALKMDLTWLTNRLPEGDEKIGRIHGMKALVDDSIALMHRIATELRPNLLDDLGLNAALEWQAHEFSRRSGISCKVNLPQHDLGLDPALKTTLFRIFQETLTNVTRHAQATRVNVSLQLKDKSVILTTQDNGIGISKGELEEPRSLGLLSLRERAAQWDGETTILGVPGKGTTVTTRIPLTASTVDKAKR